MPSLTTQKNVDSLHLDLATAKTNHSPFSNASAAPLQMLERMFDGWVS
jgi:hypothetical protein